MANTIVAPVTPLEPVAAATRADQTTVGGDQGNIWQSEYSAENPAFVREAFEAMQPTGCFDTDTQNLPQFYAQDSAMQEQTTYLYDAAMGATKVGNLDAEVRFKKAADMLLSRNEDLHDTEHTIEEERPYS